MAEQTKIQWAHHTHNIVWGCTRVSEECRNCYAEAFAKRTGHGWGPTAPRRVLSDAYWRQPLKWDRAAAKAGERRRVFCSSMADVFEDHLTVAEQRERLWPLIEQTPHLDWLLLTKRPENMLRFAPWVGKWPRNVWAGTTCGLQSSASRVVDLCEVPAVVRFVSAEPLLGPVDHIVGANPIHWVIAGGESGPRARPCDLDWLRSLRDQCKRAEVPFFCKQLGARPILDGQALRLKDRKGGAMHEWPEDLRVRQLPSGVTS